MHRSVVSLKTLILSFITCSSFYTNAQHFPALPPSQLVLPDADQEIKLVWGGDSMDAKWDPYASLLIPVKLTNCSKKFYMQFDLGAPSSLLYLDKLKEIGLKYPTAVQVTDSTTKLHDVHFKSGKTEIIAKELIFFPFTIKLFSIDKNSIFHKY